MKEEQMHWFSANKSLPDYKVVVVARDKKGTEYRAKYMPLWLCWLEASDDSDGIKLKEASPNILEPIVLENIKEWRYII